MIINQPEVNNIDGKIVISSNVEIRSSSLASKEMPHKLWFSFPETYQDFISYKSDGFVASLIIRAMRLGENVEVRGTTSARLAYGLEEYQAIFNTWLPKQLKRVSITYNELAPSRDQFSSGSVGTAFSGGVDSFHTLSLHLPQNQPNSNYHITHGLFVHGFDITLANQERYNSLWLRYEPLLQHLGVTLLTAKTNISQFYAYQFDWLYAHGGALIGTALVLGKLLRTFYIPATYDYPNLAPAGTSPLSDHLLSTENTQIIHYGASTNRTIKMDQLAQWQLPYQNLVVCINREKTNTLLNCGKCEKCVNTMIYMDLIGQLDKFPVFPRSNILVLYFRWFFNINVEIDFIKRFIKRAIAVRKFGLIPLLLLMYIGQFLYHIRYKIRMSIPYEIKYWIRKRLGIGLA